MTAAPTALEAPHITTTTETDRIGRTASLLGSWRRWGIWALLGTTALLYLWGLSRNGWANAFYSAAVQAGSQNWQAFFFGSSDAANSITVDKPPLSLWVMALSVRAFGLNSWAILVPQALMGVASVGLLYATVKRWYGPGAGLLAGALLAVTPAATLMYRFNNPDALLVLLLLAAAYATVRAIEKASPAWLMTAGALVGLGFLTKMLQAFLVLPAFAIAYAVAAPTGVWRRLRDLVLALVAMVVAGGWWIAIVELTPASSRPYIGGSQTDSVVELLLGYNGIGRITGNEVGAVGPGAGGAGAAGGGPGGFGGSTGVGRLFDGSWAGYIAWLIPVALIAAGAVLWFTRKAPRTDRLRAGALLWGLWALVTWATFSFASGIIHEYYAIALAPALAALVAIGAAVLWQRREQPAARITLAIALAMGALTATWVLTLAGGWYALVGLAVGIVGTVAAVAVSSPMALTRYGTAALVTACTALLIGPLLFSGQTAATAQTGSLPHAGPHLAGSSGGAGAAGGAAPGGMSGLLDSPTVGSELVRTLTADADEYTWVAAGIGSMSTAGYQLATDSPVMAIGGFNGSDPSPTLAQFQQYVSEGTIHYFLGGGGFGPSQGGASSSSEISTWVEQNFSSTTVDGVVLYDLTTPTTG
jgi:4-amino-4-deoxy-L-arabinose transferase-like glycosyltransferase